MEVYVNDMLVKSKERRPQGDLWNTKAIQNEVKTD